jgi:fructose-bisphosphate aldolase class II
MEAASKSNSPVMIQVSNGGGAFFTGKSIKDKNAAAAGSVAMALHVRAVAPY